LAAERDSFAAKGIDFYAAGDKFRRFSRHKPVRAVS
jgi:hypothetical protein